jgi:transposase
LKRPGPRAERQCKIRGAFLALEKQVAAPDALSLADHPAPIGSIPLDRDQGLSTACYKGLWRVERTFREEKSTLEVRPIYHQRDDTRSGHIVASFLALRLEVDLQARPADKRVETLRLDLMRDLKQLHAML